MFPRAFPFFIGHAPGRLSAMWFKNLVRFWTNWKERKQAQRRRKNSKPTGRWARALLNVETLEDRTVPAISVFFNGVLETTGTAWGDLDQAIQDANGALGTDDIEITGSGTIDVGFYGPLTTIIDDVNIYHSGAGAVTLDG